MAYSYNNTTTVGYQGKANFNSGTIYAPFIPIMTGGGINSPLINKFDNTLPKFINQMFGGKSYYLLNPARYDTCYKVEEIFNKFSKDFPLEWIDNYSVYWNPYISQKVLQKLIDNEIAYRHYKDAAVREFMEL